MSASKADDLGFDDGHERAQDREAPQANLAPFRDNATMVTDSPAATDGDAGALFVFVPIEGSGSVNALLLRPPSAHACYVFAHGAGAGMRQGFMAAFAAGLAGRGIATLRFNFPFMDKGSRRPDPAPLAEATIRAAVAVAAERCAGLPLFAGGKSFGGRMTSQAQAKAALPGVVGLVFVGFPLHPAGKPSVERAAHLAEVGVPMLFLQGTRDEFATTELLLPVIDRLGERAALALVDDADHSFHVRARSGRTDAQVLHAMLDKTASWIGDRVRGA